jgi:hypothetical protein
MSSANTRGVVIFSMMKPPIGKLLQIAKLAMQN